MAQHQAALAEDAVCNDWSSPENINADSNTSILLCLNIVNTKSTELNCTK